MSIIIQVVKRMFIIVMLIFFNIDCYLKVIGFKNKTKTKQKQALPNSAGKLPEYIWSCLLLF